MLAKNFAVKPAAFDHIPNKERFIFPVKVPPPLADDAIKDPNGKVALNMKFALMKQPAALTNGGSVRIADMRNFTVSSDIAAALVEVPPGRMREIHWHPVSDEWQYYIAGEARMTVFGAQSNARTFDYRADHVGYVPKGMPHYVENTGGETLRFLELFKSGRYMDVSLKQWMANRRMNWSRRISISIAIWWTGCRRIRSRSRSLCRGRDSLERRHAIDLEVERSGPGVDEHEDARRRVFGEIAVVDGVERGEALPARHAIDIALDDVVQATCRPPPNTL